MILFCTFKNILITLNKTADFATFLRGLQVSKKTYIVGRGKMYLEFPSSLSHPTCKQLTYWILKHLVQICLFVLKPVLSNSLFRFKMVLNMTLLRRGYAQNLGRIQ